MIGHRTRFRENDDLPPWRGPAAKKKPLFFYARALITCEIMRSRGAQCNTGNDLNLSLITLDKVHHVRSHVSIFFRRLKETSKED